ncbi:MAG: hypothetical protein ACRDE2_14265 [Chitinophagaceae bacterium]
MEEKNSLKEESQSYGGQKITLQQAAERTSLFRNEYVTHRFDKEEVIKANMFSKETILEVLNQPGCCGIRIYNSVNPQGIDPVTKSQGPVRELLLVGTDSNGNDILTTADYAPPGKGGKGCNVLSALIALPSSPQQAQDAVLVANPDPCPNMCSTPPNQLTGN